MGGLLEDTKGQTLKETGPLGVGRSRDWSWEGVGVGAEVESLMEFLASDDGGVDVVSDDDEVRMLVETVPRGLESWTLGQTCLCICR